MDPSDPTGVIRPIECLTKAWELIKPDYWLFFAITLAGVLISGLTMNVLLGPMMCGIFYAFLRRIDGQPVAFDQLWKGFEWFWPGLIVSAFIVLPIIILYAIIYLPIAAAILAGPNMSEDEFLALLFTALSVDAILLVLMVCFHTLLMFAFPLIADRHLQGMAAIKTSAKAVWRNLGGVAGLIVLNFVLLATGYLALCVGVYFVLPIVVGTNAIAYRTVFPSNASAGFTSP
jgi:hypothetical protein